MARKVYKVRSYISGLRDLKPWPGVGQPVELDVDEAADYLAAGYIVEYEDGEKHPKAADAAPQPIEAPTPPAHVSGRAKVHPEHDVTGEEFTGTTDPKVHPERDATDPALEAERDPSAPVVDGEPEPASPAAGRQPRIRKG